MNQWKFTCWCLFAFTWSLETNVKWMKCFWSPILTCPTLFFDHDYVGFIGIHGFGLNAWFAVGSTECIVNGNVQYPSSATDCRPPTAIWSKSGRGPVGIRLRSSRNWSPSESGRNATANGGCNRGRFRSESDHGRARIRPESSATAVGLCVTSDRGRNRPWFYSILAAIGLRWCLLGLGVEL